VQVKVLDIDRDRQRISLGLKQTQNDPWQQVTESYGEGDVVEGRVTKVVTFGAFVEILPGVEGLVHISELAQHHVENPREVVAPGDEIKVKILEIDSERRRLSLSVKRVEGQVLPSELRGDGPGTVEPMEGLEGAEGFEDAQGAQGVEDVEPVEGEEGEEAATPPASEPTGEAGDLDDVPELGLSEDVFADNQPEQ